MVSKEITSLVVSDKQIDLDYKMVPYDLWGTRAHSAMLCHCTIIDKERAVLIFKALAKIEEIYSSGEFEIDPALGAQLTLEKYLVELAGERAGLSVHTARSRNDQVMTAETLYIRERALNIIGASLKLQNTLLWLASEHKSTVMPGYTHMQPAKPTTFAHFCLAAFDAFSRANRSVLVTVKEFNRSPLGAVESFGTSWPIDREFSAKLLGFDGVWEIPQDAISWRGLYQHSLLSNLNQYALVISRLATDLLLYSTWEYNFLEAGDPVSERLHPITGSSVMAQKRNPDALEILRSVAPQVSAAYQAVSGILAALPCGYSRDSREIKQYAESGLSLVEKALSVLNLYFNSVRVNKERMKSAVEENYSLTTDLADYISFKSAAPYRRVYKVVGGLVNELISEGILLRECGTERLQKTLSEAGIDLDISAEDFKAVVDASSAITKRRHTGGTAHEIIESMIENRKAIINKQESETEKIRRKISEGRKLLKETINQVVNW
ncbi:MAG: argininosuccinate lyase [Candidatus Dadabacteria bacterium]|nr:MAG: argininosuccinate lyase [Candidatus Dadabacteria bacterium]